MLLAVEGGGFFSSSASGYSNGLALILLGQRNEDRPMRVSPLNQNHLVGQESNTDFQLVSGKNRNVHGCASFVCFGRASAGLHGQSALKNGPTQPQDIFLGDPAAGRDMTVIRNVENENDLRHTSLKSNLKKQSHCVLAPNNNENGREPLDEQCSDNLGLTEQRKVQWTDACGRELAEIREFEVSETGDSDDELENGGRKICSCRIIRARFMELRRCLLNSRWLRRRSWLSLCGKDAAAPRICC